MQRLSPSPSTRPQARFTLGMPVRFYGSGAVGTVQDIRPGTLGEPLYQVTFNNFISCWVRESAITAFTEADTEMVLPEWRPTIADRTLIKTSRALTSDGEMMTAMPAATTTTTTK